MTTSLYKLHYQHIFLSSEYRTNHRSKSNPIKKSTSFRETKNKMNSGINLKFRTPATLNQKSTIGIIGGFSAYSTLVFLEKLVSLSSEDGKDCFPFIVCSDPDVLTGATDGQTDLNRCAIVENVRRKRVFLEQSGARCIVMPCQITQGLHEEVSRGCPVTFLSIGDCVARELRESKLKPLEAGSNLRIGVLAADAAFVAGFYRQKLQDQGFDVVIPDKPTMEHIVIPAIEALKEKDTEGARTLTKIAIQVLLVRAVNRIILASDEFQGLLPPNDLLLQKCIDPVDALARSTIKWAKSIEKKTQLNLASSAEYE